MVYFWFVSAPLHGHLDWGGLLKTALRLQGLMHPVTWVSENGIQAALQGLPFKAIDKTGWLWPPPPVPDVRQMPPAQAVMLRYTRALDTWLSEDWVAAGVESLLRLAEEHGKPELIVTDPFLSAAALAAERLDVPLVVGGWPALQDIQEEGLYAVQKALADDARGRLSRLCQRFGLQGRYFSGGATPGVHSPYLHMTYFSKAWYQAEEELLLPETQFFGGLPTVPTTPPPDWLAAIPADVPLAFITLGSVFTGDLGFFAWAAQAAARVGLVPVVAIGRQPLEPAKKAELKAALPKQTRLLSWAPYEHILPRCKLMIHHGGMGTTHAGVVYGVPQIVVPHAADQRENAVRVAQAKVGLNLTAHEVRHGALLQGAKALVSDERVQEQARQWAADFAALGGAPAAAQTLLNLLERLR